MFDRISGGLCTAGNLQLGEDAADVGFHGGEADNHGLGDLLVVLSLYDQVQYFQLAFRQVKQGLLRWASCLNKHLGSFGGKRRPAGSRQGAYPGNPPHEPTLV